MTEVRRKGRRPAGEDTKAALVEAARAVFAEHGFAGATVRQIAARAGVDAAMVNHWFGGKQGLFVAAMELPFNPEDILPILLTGPPDQLAERIVRTFLTVWDTTGADRFTALMRSIASHDAAIRMLREFVTEMIFGRIARTLNADNADFRAALCGSQVIGMGLMRYVVRLEPITSADIDTMVTAVAPTLHRYLFGSIN